MSQKADTVYMTLKCLKTISSLLISDNMLMDLSNARWDVEAFLFMVIVASLFFARVWAQ